MRRTQRVTSGHGDGRAADACNGAMLLVHPLAAHLERRVDLGRIPLGLCRQAGGQGITASQTNS